MAIRTEALAGAGAFDTRLGHRGGGATTSIRMPHSRSSTDGGWSGAGSRSSSATPAARDCYSRDSSDRRRNRRPSAALAACGRARRSVRSDRARVTSAASRSRSSPRRCHSAERDKYRCGCILLAEANPELECVVFDLPEVPDDGRSGVPRPPGPPHVALQRGVVRHRDPGLAGLSSPASLSVFG
jgi:hypothetical protein